MTKALFIVVFRKVFVFFFLVINHVSPDYCLKAVYMGTLSTCTRCRVSPSLNILYDHPSAHNDYIANVCI